MKKVRFFITGMHCVSCALNIDFALEDLGVKSAKTSYARSKTEVEFDPTKISVKQITEAIEKIGYQVILTSR